MLTCTCALNSVSTTGYMLTCERSVLQKQLEVVSLPKNQSAYPTDVYISCFSLLVGRIKLRGQ